MALRLTSYNKIINKILDKFLEEDVKSIDNVRITKLNKKELKQFDNLNRNRWAFNKRTIFIAPFKRYDELGIKKEDVETLLDSLRRMKLKIIFNGGQGDFYANLFWTLEIFDDEPPQLHMTKILHEACYEMFQSIYD